MSLYLTVDCGNTSVKLTLWDESTPVRVGRYASPDDVRIAEWPVADAGIVSSVRTHAERIAKALETRVKKLYVLSASLPLPIAIDYSTPTTLGSDRIAAACGATALHGGRELLVVDAGTAVTYDRVSADGHYRGGNIAPGLHMRLEALHTLTARLPLVEVDPAAPLWGHDTVSALQAGALNGIVAEVAYYRAALPEDAVVVITGGDAQTIADRLDFDADIVPDLVSIGLHRIITYNEDK